VHIVSGGGERRAETSSSAWPLRLEVNDLVLQPLASSMPCLRRTKRNSASRWSTWAGTTDSRCSPRRDPPHRCDSDPGDQSATTSRWRCARRSRTRKKSNCVTVCKEVLADAGEKIRSRGLAIVRRHVFAPDARGRDRTAGAGTVAIVQRVVRDSGYEELISSGVVLTAAQVWCRVSANWRRTVPETGAHRLAYYNGALADVARNPRFAP